MVPPDLCYGANNWFEVLEMGMTAKFRNLICRDAERNHGGLRHLCYEEEGLITGWEEIKAKKSAWSVFGAL